MIRRGPLPALLAVLVGATLVSCAGGDASPAPLDTRNETCRFCRMPVSDRRLAAQLAAAGEEPLFFDDLGCLRDYLKESGGGPRGGVAYVADHRTGAWVRASRAVFSRCPDLSTPMSSHLVAHADAGSRQADAAARVCAEVRVSDLFGPGGPPDGVRR